MTAATIVMPTTGDRGPCLALAAKHAMRQTVDDVELFIIGDGLDRPSAATARDLERSDPRIRFFDRPKGPRRGELNRHEILREHARGEIVTYVTDRDLYLPSHVETLHQLLVDADFAYTLRFRVGEADQLIPGVFPDHRIDAVRQSGHAGIPLSFAGHRLDYYHDLPHGWRTTPEAVGTDTYMWEQFLAQPDCRVAVSARPTVLSFKRGAHPGWSTERRLEILERWAPRLEEPDFERWLVGELLSAHVRQASELGGWAPPRRTLGRRALRRAKVLIDSVGDRRRRSS